MHLTEDVSSGGTVSESRVLGMPLLRRFLRSQKGVSALEFALVAPIMLLAITGIIDLMLVMFVSSLMEGGLRDGSRLGRIGFVPVSGTREEAVAQKIADATIGLVDMSKVQITTKIYQDFSSVGKPEPFVDANGNNSFDAGESYTDVNSNGTWDADQGVAGLGSPNNIVLYTVRYDWTLLTPLLPAILPNGTKFPIEVSLAVRNEPWGTPPPPAP